MKLTRKALLALAIGLLVVAAPLARGNDDEDDDSADDEKDVVVLTKDNFDKIMKKHKYALVE